MQLTYHIAKATEHGIETRGEEVTIGSTIRGVTYKRSQATEVGPSRGRKKKSRLVSTHATVVATDDSQSLEVMTLIQEATLQTVGIIVQVPEIANQTPKVIIQEAVASTHYEHNTVPATVGTPERAIVASQAVVTPPSPWALIPSI